MGWSNKNIVGYTELFCLTKLIFYYKLQQHQKTNFNNNQHNKKRAAKQKRQWQKIAGWLCNKMQAEKSVNKGKEYSRIWVYVPTKVSEDTAFMFKIGEPCSVEIDEKKNSSS
jgi:hypothetical protein